MATFPSIGTVMVAGYKQSPVSAVRRTAMDGGLPKQAAKFSRALLQRNITYLLTSAEKSTFSTFFQDTINRGADWFQWTDPLDDVEKTVRIVNGTLTETPSLPGPRWFVGFVLESWDA